MKNKLIVVIGARGRQGQSVINSLIIRNYNIRALVRNPVKINSVVSETNVEIFKGDLRNKDSLRGLYDNAYGLFFALPPSKASVDFGKSLLDLAKESNLEHIIYSSVGGADRYSKVDHFCYKKEIEENLRKLGKPYTILRPAGYMDEFVNSKSAKFIISLLKLYLPESKKFQLISVKDIGIFATIAFDNPDKYIGAELEIAGDELTLNEMLEKIERIKKIKISPIKIPGFVKLILPKIMKQMFVFYSKDGWKSDLKSLRNKHPELLTFDDWLITTDIIHNDFQNSQNTAAG